jgi:hypothetical protein
VLQGMTVYRLAEVEMRHRMETNVQNIQGKETLKATIPNTDYDGSKINEECGIFQMFP